MKKKASILFLLRILKLLVGIFNLSLAAKYFGISEQRDIWLLAFNGVVVLDMALWGPINETFRTKFILIKEQEGEEKALQQTRSLLFFTVLISIFIAVILFMGASTWAKMLAPHMPANQALGLSKMLMVLAPSFLISQLTLILISILNAYQSFYIPEISSFLSALMNLGLLMLLAPIIGIYSLAIAYYIGLILLLILLLHQLQKKQVVIFRSQRIVFSDFKLFFLYAIPFFLPYFLGQLNGLVEKSLASTIGEGFVSIVDYGRKFPDMALTVLTSVLTTMMVPALTSAFARHDQISLHDSFKQIFQLGLIITGLLVAFLNTSATPLIGLFYDKGTIASTALQSISKLAMQYSWAAFGVFLYLITGLALLATDQRKQYALFGMLAQAVMIIFNWLLVSKLGIHVFPISMLVAHLLSAACMLTYLPYPKKNFLVLLVKYTTFILASILPCILVSPYISLIENYLLQLCLNASIIILFLLVNSFLFRIEEREVLLRLFRRFIKN